MFHACVKRFDGMDEKFFGGELNRALVHLEIISPFGENCVGLLGHLFGRLLGEG
jgi:hypothetical protein